MKYFQGDLDGAITNQLQINYKSVTNQLQIRDTRENYICEILPARSYPNQLLITVEATTEVKIHCHVLGRRQKHDIWDTTLTKIVRTLTTAISETAKQKY